jgi:hypothetical protein
MILFRKILFYLFFALYLVLCPMIILYALGYIFTPKVEEGFAKTGLIHIETLPPNAVLSIGNKRYLERTPATIRNLLSGQYDVKVFLRGHRPWERMVKVDPGKAVNLEKVLLIPQSVKTQTLAAEPFEDLLPVPGTHYLLLKGVGPVGDLKMFDWKNEVLRSVLPESSPFKKAKFVKVFKIKESSFVILQVETLEGVKFLGCQLNKEGSEIEDLSSLFAKGEPYEILWEGDHPDYLFAWQGQDLSRLDLEKMTTLPDFFPKIRGFGLYKNKIYALQGSSVVRLGFHARKGEEVLVEKGIFLENLFKNIEKYRIDFISNNAVVFRGEQGELFANVLPYRFVEEGMRGYQADTEGRKLVLWQRARVGVLDFERSEHRKELFERGPEIEWVIENGHDIRQAYFVQDADSILFCDRDQVFLSRVGAYGTPPEGIITVQKGSGIFYAEKTGKLYYLEPARGELAAADILPEGVTFSGVMNELGKGTQETAK